MQVRYLMKIAKLLGLNTSLVELEFEFMDFCGEGNTLHNLT
jgi:hypothetical protein